MQQIAKLLCIRVKFRVEVRVEVKIRNMNHDRLVRRLLVLLPFLLISTSWGIVKAVRLEICQLCNFIGNFCQGHRREGGPRERRSSTPRFVLDGSKGGMEEGGRKGGGTLEGCRRVESYILPSATYLLVAVSLPPSLPPFLPFSSLPSHIFSPTRPSSPSIVSSRSLLTRQKRTSLQRECDADSFLLPPLPFHPLAALSLPLQTSLPSPPSLSYSLPLLLPPSLLCPLRKYP